MFRCVPLQLLLPMLVAVVAITIRRSRFTSQHVMGVAEKAVLRYCTCTSRLGTFAFGLDLGVSEQDSLQAFKS